MITDQDTNRNVMGLKRQLIKKTIGTLIAGLSLFSMSGWVSAERIVIAADIWCPFNCQPDSEQPGFMVEIAQRVFSEHGHDVQYVEMGWERAIHEARRGNINAVIGAYKGDAPDFVFPDQEMALVGNTFFARKEVAWRYDNIDSLQTVNLGIIKGYDYGEDLKEHIDQNSGERVFELIGDNPLQRGIKMLMAERLDTVIEGAQVFWHTASQLGLQDQFVVAGQAGELNRSYIAFSPKIEASNNYAELLSEGISRLRVSGELGHILHKYGLSDWR